MDEAPVRSFASSIDKPLLFQIGNQLANLPRHEESIIGNRSFKGNEDRRRFEAQGSSIQAGDAPALPAFAEATARQAPPLSSRRAVGRSLRAVGYAPEAGPEAVLWPTNE